MPYILGVDLGTTFSAAAVATGDRAEIVTLGTRSATVPSVVVLHPHGEVLVGEAAERRSLSEPGRTAREFKRRLGDPTPLLLGGTPYGAEALMAHLLRYLVEAVTEQMGSSPELIVMSHPANYGPYKKDLLQEAVRLADVGRPVEFITEPEAAAVHYAGQERVEEGDVVAVYDFGGGTFDAAVVRKVPTGFELIGTPEGMERFGGIDFDQAIFAFVDESLGGLIQELDPADPSHLAAVARLRDECRAAKEVLSADTDVSVPVLLPNVQTEVRITRPEFEAMIRPRLNETTDALERAVRSAGLSMDDVGRVLLVGGSSRIPLVAQVVRDATGRPVGLDAHPKHAIALGAAQAGAARHAELVAAAAPAPAPTDDEASAAVAAPTTPVAAGATTKKRSPAVFVAAAVVALVLAGGAVYALTGGGGGDSATPPTASPSNGGDTTDTTATTGTTDTTEGPPGTGGEEFPDGAFAQFIPLCQDQGVKKVVCQCVADGIPTKLTFEEWQELDAALQENPDMELPGKVSALFENCVEQDRAAS